MADSELLQVSTPQAGVRVVAFNRPQKRNALSKQLIKDFLGALDRASADSEIRAIIITGNGPLFSGRCLSITRTHLIDATTITSPLLAGCPWSRSQVRSGGGWRNKVFLHRMPFASSIPLYFFPAVSPNCLPPTPTPGVLPILSHDFVLDCQEMLTMRVLQYQPERISRK